MSFFPLAQEVIAGEDPPRSSGSFVIVLSLIVLALWIYVNKRIKEKAREKARIAAIRKKQEQLKIEYSKEYEIRKSTIGTIKCTQCGWTGEWGTGMSYEQFFAGNLAEAGIIVSQREKRNDNLSSDNRQYTCPLCNSDKWVKV